MKHLTLAITLIVVAIIAVPAAGQSWSVAIEENAGVTTCGKNKNIPVAGATDCDTAKKAAWDLLKLLQAGGCVGPACPGGAAITPGVATCKYDPYTRKNGSKANRWQINWKWTCEKPIAPACCKCLGETASVDLSTGQATPIDLR